MRSLLARLAVLGAFAVSISACTGNSSSLPFAGPPNQSGGNPGIFQSGATGSSLLRFVNGSPDYANVDICIDNAQFSGGAVQPIASYGRAASGANGAQNTLTVLPAGIPHTIAVYNSLGGTNAGNECPTAPGPYLGLSPIAVTSLTPAVNSRITFVLGGTAAKGTLGLYGWTDPSFVSVPASPEAYTHNAAPNFTASLGTPKSVGFGYCTTTVTPCAVAVGLTGAGNVPVGPKSGLTATLGNSTVSLMPAIPPGFYDGAGVLAGTPVPITSVATPSLAAGQPPVYELIAIDGPAGGLNLVVLAEQSAGFGF